MHELMDLLVESVGYLDAAGANADVSKTDVVESMRERLCVITGRIIAYPSVSNFALPYTTVAVVPAGA